VPRRVLIASSANIYGNAAGGMLDEATPPQPVNHYAVSKLAMEHMVRTWHDRLPIVMTRPFNYTGVGQSPSFLVPKIVSHFTRREPVIELGNIDIERDFSDVRMVARVYRALLEADCAGQTVNVCSGRAYALRDIVSMMQEIAGYAIEVRVNPAFVRYSDVRTLAGSSAKLNALVGAAAAMPMPFDETLRWMVTA
ncbi:MAG: GDP-mannose 4,6-dehydratase, partial [Herminiimonas sp.]|nr:GDP-mannose 4,6-dehydratase [Herminiimonas sp.]